MPETHRSRAEAEIQTTAGATVTNSQAAVVPPDNVPSVPTTISARAEAAARRAAAQHKNTSIVAIQPSTGKVLAIANNDGYNDFALTAAVAPGSTGKIISATALLADHVLTPDSDVTTGTAAGLGFGPAVYAKTGTADINGQEQPSSWFTAFDPSKDVAVACLVLNAATAPSRPPPKRRRS